MQREDIHRIQWECQQFLNRVTMLMDTAKWEELAACYTDDAVLFRPSDSGTGIEGREAILESFRSRPPRTTCHILANSVFTVESPDRVIAASRVWLMSGVAAENHPVPAQSKLLAGSFNDHLVYKDGGWYIQRREGSIELQYDFAAALSP